MTEPERIKSIEEQIPLAGLLPGVNLEWFPPEESEKLRRAVLDVYRLSHARGFKAGADHAINAIASALQPPGDDSRAAWMKRRISSRMRERWRDYKNSLNSIRATVFRKFSEE
jgi:histidinol-phosphate/aromatic aminotransferase/cobyric acid decarboxylase-like protein